MGLRDASGKSTGNQTVAVHAASGKSTSNRAVNWRAIIGAIIEMGFIIGGLVANLVFLPHMLSSDALLRFAELSQLLNAQTLSASRFSLVGP
ncbi:MAG: hypothetical protein ACLQUY_11500, partial [Ktedonobacterales bacterium]